MYDPFLILVIIFCIPSVIMLFLYIALMFYRTCYGPRYLIYPENIGIGAEGQHVYDIPLYTKELGKDCFITLNPQEENEYMTLCIVCSCDEEQV